MTPQIPPSAMGAGACPTDDEMGDPTAASSAAPPSAMVMKRPAAGEGGAALLGEDMAAIYDDDEADVGMRGIKTLPARAVDVFEAMAEASSADESSGEDIFGDDDSEDKAAEFINDK
eukprot:10345299-Heterocapsa_arctica.AAC.1